MRGGRPGRASVELGGEVVVRASSFDQRLILFGHILRSLGPSFERYGSGPRGRFRVQDSANQASITDRATGAMLKVHGSGRRRLHGLAPDF